MVMLIFECGVLMLGQQIVYVCEFFNLVELVWCIVVVDDLLIWEWLIWVWIGLCVMCFYVLVIMEGLVVEQFGQDNVLKLLWVNWYCNLGELVMDVIGKFGMIMFDGEFDEWQWLYLFICVDIIYGGFNEIQCNIIVEWVFGLFWEVKG